MQKTGGSVASFVAGVHTAELARLGPHTTGVGCLYIKDLDAVDHGVLRRIIKASEGFARGGGDDHAHITITD
jgi:hypothetical protein